MTCAACSSRVEKAVSKLDGVSSCAVNLLTNSMTVETSLPDEEIIAAVEKAGYGAKKAGGYERKNRILPKKYRNKTADTKTRFVRYLSRHTYVFLYGTYDLSASPLFLGK